MTNRENKTIKLSEFKTQEVVGVDSTKSDLFFNSELSYNANQLSFRVIIGHYIYAGMKVIQDSFVVFNSETNELRKIANPLRLCPIRKFYYHNQDSLFIFLDRSFVLHTKSQTNNQYMDFYLINAKGEITNSYSLDNVPLIDSHEDSNKIDLTPMTQENDMIINGNFYIPFYTFNRLEKYKNSRTKLLCEYNLRTKNAKMLDVHVEPEYYIEQSDNSHTMTFKYKFINDSILIYSFTHNPLIYKFNINDQKSEKLNALDVFYTSKNKNKTYNLQYDFPKYVSKDKMYIRSITIHDFSVNTNLYLTEIMDTNFANLSYSILTPPKPSAYIYNGYLVSKNKTEPKDQNIYNVMVQNNQNLNLDDFEQNYIYQKNDELDKLKKLPKKGSFEKRFFKYIEEMGIANVDRVVCINIDCTCGSTISYLIGTIVNNEKEIKNKNLKILFYSENAQTIESIIQQYKELKDYVVVDKNSLFMKYLKEKEYNKVPMLTKNAEKFTFFKLYKCEEVDGVFRQLMAI